MKKIVSLLCAILLVVSLGACRNPESLPTTEEKNVSSSLPEKEAVEETSSPESAVTSLLDELKALDAESAAAYLAEKTGKADTMPESYGKVIVPLVDRLQIETKNSKITGDTAMVDVSVTAVDAKSLLSEILLSSATFLALNKNDPDFQDKLIQKVAEDVDFSKLSTIRTDSTVYLVKDAKDEWNIDLNNPDNLEFLNAVGGGALDIAENMRSLFQQ